MTVFDSEIFYHALSLQPIRKTLLSPEGQRILAAMPAVETYSGRMAYARALCFC